VAALLQTLHVKLILKAKMQNIEISSKFLFVNMYDMQLRRRISSCFSENVQIINITAVSFNMYS